MGEIITLREPFGKFDTRDKRIYREGIALEKGVTITPRFLESNEDLIQQYFQYWTAYPDAFLDLIKPADSTFYLFPFQRIFLRACMRFRVVYFTAARATSKTFLTVLALILQVIFIPGRQCFIAAPNKNQAAKIAEQKIKEIFNHWPLLEKEFITKNYGKDYIKLETRGGGKLTIAAPLDSDRGVRRHGGLIDEVRDHDGQALDEIVLPQLNVSRRTAAGLLNPNDINQQLIYATSAGTKSSFAYEKLLETFVSSVIDPQNHFTMGLDWRIPARHSLIDAKYVQSMRLNPSYSDLTFASEYLGQWLGGSEEAWFQLDRLSRYRMLKNPEWQARPDRITDGYYLISVDVGRISDQTVATVFRVNVINSVHRASIVNIIVLGRSGETKGFPRQALDIKRLIKNYDPREVVIDTNGLGIGLGDEMAHTHLDPHTGELHPAYGFFNDDNFKKTQPADAICILYSLKASSTLKSRIHGNAYSKLMDGKVHFLIREQDAKNALLATKMGQKMPIEKRVERLLPHQMTTSLFTQLANMRLKKTGGLDIVLEPINTRYPDDKYMSFAYGLWRIKELEDITCKRQRRGGKTRKMIFFSGGI